MKAKNHLWVTLIWALVFITVSCPDPVIPKEPVLPGLGDLEGDISISPDGEVTLGTELTAVYNGSEAVSFQWNRDGAVLGNASSEKFTPAVAGNYSVTVSAESYNSKTSNSVSVVNPPETPVLQKPVIKLPEGIDKEEVPVGTELTAQYNGTEDISFQWNKDGTPIEDEIEITFIPTETGAYTVTVSLDGYESTTSDSVTVVPIPLLQKPVIELSEGTDKDNVLIGTKLTAVYSGEENVSFQWNNAEGPIPNETNEEFTPSSTGVYTVTVSAEGCLDNTSDAVTVILRTLSGNISITLPAGVNTGNVFTTMPLTAVYTAGTETEVSFKWFKDDTEVASGTIFVPDTAGTYTVTAIMENYTEKTSAVIEVKAFVAVTEITGYAAKIYIDEPSVIGGAVNTGASFTDIIWSIAGSNANPLADIDNQGRLLAEGFGTITLTATVENGLGWELDFVRNYTVDVATFIVMNITMEDTDFGLVDIGEAIFNNAGTVLSASTPVITLIIADSTLTEINWYLGNIALAANTNSYTLNYAAFNNAGSYTLTVFFKDAEGRRWSGNYTFTVSHE